MQTTPPPTRPNQRGTPQTARRIARRAGGWLLLAAAIPLGAAAGIAALLAVAAATDNRILAATAGALALVATAGGLSWLAARGITGTRRPRRWLPAATTGITLVAVGAVVGGLVFAPAPDASLLAATDATRYWELPTGSRIAYIHTPAQGTANPAPVIVVHGGPGAPPRTQHPAAPTLAQTGYDVYDYHQVGAGLSSRLADVGDYTVARHVADLEAIRAQIGAEQVTLVGESWGGKLIANYLAAHPDRVAKAVITSPSAIWSPAFADDERLTAAGRTDQDAVIAEHPRLLAAHALMRTAGPQAASSLLPDTQMDGVFESLVGRLNHSPGCAAGQATTQRAAGDQPAGYGFWANAATTWDATRIPDPRPALRDASAPVLVLRGECDYNAWEVTREYRDLLPEAVLLTVDDAGHLVTRDRLELYRQAVGAFLQDQPLPQEPYTAAAEPRSADATDPTVAN